MKVSRNDPCTCGSGKKYKKCCYLTESAKSAAQSASGADSQDPRSHNRSLLDTQLAKFAPTITVDDCDAKIRAALAKSANASPMAVIEEVFNDDNLKLNNKRQADRLFKAFMAVWADIAQEHKAEK